MPFASHPDGSRIYYEVHGEGPSVTFIHGSGGHHAAWWQQTPHFRNEFSVLTLDLRGFGRSVPVADDYGSSDFPGDILAVLDDAGIDRTVLVAQSLGGPAALRVAISDPDRVAGVVLAHSLGGIVNDDLSALVKADRAEAEKLSVLDRLLSKDFQDGEPEKTFLFTQMGSFNTANLAELRKPTPGGPTIEDITSSGVKICFLAGEDDAVVRPDTVRMAHGLLPDSVLEIVPGATHSQYWESPEEFNAVLERLLHRIY